MKTLTIVLALLLSVPGMVSAAQVSQSQSTSVNGGKTKANGTLAQSMSSKRAVAVKPFDPQPTGILYEYSQKGLSVFSPLSNYKEGASARFLSDNPFPTTSPAYATSYRSSMNASEYGGIKLFGWNF